MQIVFHIGAHVTDGERLLRALQKDADGLAASGIAVPPHPTYRRALRDAAQVYNSGASVEGERDKVLAGIGADAGCRRLVLSNPAFICTPNRIFEGREFYALVRLKAQAMDAIFPDDGIVFCLGTRNPATFVPAVFEQARARDVASYLEGMAPTEIRWSSVLSRLRAAVPRAGVVVWANEDTALIWGRILRRMAGLDFAAPLAGDHDLLAEIMTDEGMRRCLGYLNSHPPRNQAQLDRAIAAFLGRYAKPEEIEEEIDMPGWDAATIAAVTAAYEDDLERIAQMDGVEMLVP